LADFRILSPASPPSRPGAARLLVFGAASSSSPFLHISHTAPILAHVPYGTYTPISGFPNSPKNSRSKNIPTPQFLIAEPRLGHQFKIGTKWFSSNGRSHLPQNSSNTTIKKQMADWFLFIMEQARSILHIPSLGQIIPSKDLIIC
jgi:hypothetical protein